MRQYNSKLILIPGFAFIILILVLLSGVWIYNVNQNQDTLNEIFGEQAEALYIVTMLQSAQERAISLHRMAIIEDEFARDAEYIDFMAKAETFIKARDEFLAQKNIFNDELKIWEQVKPHVVQGSRLQSETVELILQGKIDEANVLLLDNVIPTQTQVMAYLTKMLDLQREKMQNEVNSAAISNRQIFWLVVVLGSVAGAIAVGIAIASVRRTTRVEASLHQARLDAQAATEQKSRFLANMSHEIRTPMTAVLGFAETLLDENLTTTQRFTHTKSILRNGDHLLSVLNDILDLSKIEAKQLAVEKLDVSPVQIAHDVEAMVADRANEKGLPFDVNYRFPLPEWINTDPTRLRQILLNLVSNAIKFTDSGWVSIDVIYSQHEQQMEFVVSDSGIGMTQEEQQNIFSAFSQADVSTTRKYGGTGLGLCISKQLAQMLGGDLRCSSEKGSGSTFRLTISVGENINSPVIENIEEVGEYKSAPSNSSIPSLSGEILLAEDSPDNQALVSLYIEKTGASLTIVDNGEKAVEAALSKDFDLILMDMQMPVMSGEEAVKWLREAGNRTPITMLTANAMKDERDKCMGLGANGFLTKPIVTADFYRNLSEYLQPANNNSAPLENDQHYDDDFKELVDAFLQDLPNRIDRLNNAATEEQWQELREEIHRLKGVGGGFGFPAITELCEQIEQQLTLQGILEVKKLLDDLSSYSEIIIEEKVCA
ncbi:ATP-binding protein [Kaarinaea lacus]